MFNKQQAKPGGHTALSSELKILSEPPLSAPTSAPAPRKATSPKAASLISQDIAIEGNLRGEGELQADGTVRGDVSVARLSIGESGVIEGSVHAESVEVRGKVVGAITAKQVRLYASAHVDGDITHEQLTMEAGAFFEGRSLRLQRAPVPVTGSSGGGDVIDIASATASAATS